MGLFDDIFGKEENNRLKKQLIEKTRQITAFESKISEISSIKTALESELERLRRSVQKKSDELNSLTKSLNTLKSESIRTTKSLKELERSSADQLIQATATIKALQLAAKQVKPEILAAQAVRDASAVEVQEVRAAYDQKERQLVKREARMAEKSAILIQENEILQQKLADLYSKEQHWKINIEPNLLKYESHLSLDLREKHAADLQQDLDIQQSILIAREADMIRRKSDDESLRLREIELSQKAHIVTNRSTELEAKSVELENRRLSNEDRAIKLEQWAQELFEFRSRVKQLDVEIIELKKRSDKIDFKEQQNKALHSERLGELRKKKSSIDHLEKILQERDIALKIREKAAKREEAQIANSKQKLLRLQEEADRLNEIIKSLEQAQLTATAYRVKYYDLERTYKALQVDHESAMEKAELAVDLKNESDQLKAQVQQLLRTSLALKRFDSSLADPVVMAWMLESGAPENFDIEQGWVGTTGDGPWDSALLDSSLVEVGYQPSVLPHHKVEYIVVGRKGWSKNELLAQIEAREGQTLWIYSQEMFFAKLVTGRDPLESENKDVLDAFAKDHPALQWLMTLPAPWPIVTNEDSGEIVVVDKYDLSVSESPLHILGYRVGATSDLSAAERRKILVICFESNKLEFSDDSKDSYILKWGRGGGAQRLYRMAIHIASLVNGRVGKDYRKPQARIDWINDLEWLRKKYFKSYATIFSWPGK
ncbi:MAG: hypothetical protein ACKOWD_05985 [Rhodoferax sp.]